MSSAPFGTCQVSGTDLQLHRVGFGAGRIFLERQSERLLHTALDCGIRHFDTAPSYSYGESEVMLGKVLAAFPDASIATKVGLPVPEGGPGALSSHYRRFVRPLLARAPRLKSALLRWRTPASTGTGTPRAAIPRATRILTRNEIMSSLESSLLRLRRNHIDILLIHEPDQFVLDDELQGTLRGLVEQGVIRAFGLGWGRVVRDPPDFGQVIQSRFDPSVPPATQPANQLAIFHGLLRSENAPASGSAPVPARRRLQDVLARAPESAVIFSASAPHQIKELLRG